MRRSSEESDFTANPYFLRTAVSAGLGQRFTTKLYGRLGVEWSRDSYPHALAPEEACRGATGTRRDTLAGANLSAGFDVLRWLTLELRLEAVRRTSSYEVFEYDDQRASFSLKASFSAGRPGARPGRGMRGESTPEGHGVLDTPYGLPQTSGQPMKLSVLVPVYNEKEFLPRLLERVRAVPLEKEVVLVDDCSTDGTREWLRGLEREGWPGDARNELRVFFHERNRGKGAAVRTALAKVSGDIAIIQDADLEYDPAEYPALIAPILAGHADVVYGSRFLGGPHRVHLFWHYAGNRFLTLVSNIFTNLNLTDVETCYKAFRGGLAPRIVLKSERFGFDPEITARLAHLKCRFYEVPISYHGRDYAEGKKITWRDGFVVLWAIFRYNVLER